MLNQKDIRRRFDRAASTFDGADFVHAVTRDGLLARLEPLVLAPEAILDLGCATGALGRRLQKRFRRARVVSLDLSHTMLAHARKNRPWLSRSTFVQADAGRLPFADASFDLVVANQLLPWAPQPQAVFEQVARVLRKGGVFAFAALGPDSLAEIRSAWAAAGGAAVADDTHVNTFPDMHDVGDGLVRAGLRDPVLDVDRLEVRYEHVGKLLDDLTRVGARNTIAARSPGLTGKQRFRRMARALEGATAGAGLSLELELVYGHCWGGGPRPDPQGYRVPADRIPRRRRPR